MAGFREKFIHFTGGFAAMLPSKFWLSLSKQDFLIPVYHTVSDRDLPHINKLYAIKNKSQFIDDLDFLLKHYRAIDYKEFSQIMNGETQSHKPVMLLTFDDGLSEFHDIIAPILLQKGVPAICFLNSAFIDNKALFYRFKSSVLINHLEQHPELEQSVKHLFEKNQNIAKQILSVSYQDQKLLDQLAKSIGYNFDEFLRTQKPYLSSSQIEALIEKGFQFGAHSVDHPEYQHITIDEQIRQTQESINTVCSKFSIKEKTFAFPFTDYNVSSQFFSTIQNKEIAEMTFGSAGQKKEIIKNHFQRVPFEMDELTGKQILNAELFYYQIKLLFGKHVIKRND